MHSLFKNTEDAEGTHVLKKETKLETTDFLIEYQAQM